ncbi:4,5-DOPA dioxygenase extradiol [Curvibacter sp. RS43]|jgi:4,5-DOPA dioxygenase extradiol|uniref:4,5-DOPA-extradiol-dioxygenase n=1 Tax=Curvibacter microcysteis TaxID=3026419 RepID=UPI002361C349|nr:4,5-DOPA dioxygenase extradiol [Curvibacter sp. RS43]MDD0809394.1 4,5-DOPA dioxygenase extradiol [Curvibacter sp. RS43]
MRLAAAADAFRALPKTARMPVMFVGHGSPMNAIDDNTYRRTWSTLGTEFGRQHPVPKLILCISAHWVSRGTWLTAMEHPKTIHDFGGFPQALFDQQYPVPGWPGAARDIQATLKPTAVQLDVDQWGLDHGTWSVLKPMFPSASIPVIQMSLDAGRSPSELFALGQQLKGLRERGVLIVGSGNIVHNLRAVRRDAAPTQVYDWAQEFDAHVQGQLKRGELAALSGFESLGSVARMAHPTAEHFWPLLVAAGAADPKEMPRFFNDTFQFASISMRSVLWG